MDLQMWLLISCSHLLVRAEPPIQPPEPNQQASIQQKPQQRYKEVIMYLTPSQIKALESGEGYIVPHQTAQPASSQDNQKKQEYIYQAAQNPQQQHQQHQVQHQQQQQLHLHQQQQQQQLHHQQQQELQQHQQKQDLQHKQLKALFQQNQQELQQQQQQKLQQQQQQFQEQQDETNKKHRLHLEEASQNQPTSLLEQNAYEQYLNQQNAEQWIPTSYPQIKQEPIPQQLIPSTQNGHYLQFEKSQPLPDNYAYMYIYPRGKPHGNENIQLVQPNPEYSEQTKLLNFKSNSNQNLQLIEAPNSIRHSSTHFDQEKHKQLVNYLVPNKFQLIPYDYSRDQSLDDLLVQQHIESQHLKAFQQVQQQENVEAQQRAHQEVQQLQQQLQAKHQTELKTQHQAQHQIQFDLQHQVLQEAQHQIQQTQHEIEHNIQLQNQQLGQLESLQQAHLQSQQPQYQAPLQTQQVLLEVPTLLPKEINLKELENHIKEHIKSQEIHRQQANEEQNAKIQQIENEKQKEIEIANMDAHHESQQIKAEQVKADEIIKSGQINAKKIEAQIAAENLEAFAKIEKSRNIGKKEKAQVLFTPFSPRQNIKDSSDEIIKSGQIRAQQIAVENLETFAKMERSRNIGNEEKPQVLFTSFNIKDLLNQNRQKLESGFIPVASNGQDNSKNKFTKEIEQILLKNEEEKQKALVKADEIAKEPPQVIKEEIKVVKRPQEVRVQEVRVPTPVFVPYPKPVEVKMPQPFIVPIEVVRPFPVPVIHTEKVEVEKPVPVEVSKVVHVPVTKNVYVPVDKPYIVEKLVPVKVEKKVPVPVHINKPQKYTIIRHVWKH